MYRGFGVGVGVCVCVLLVFVVVGGGGGGGGCHGGLPFPGTDCPVPGIGFNSFIDLYQVLEVIDTLLVYYTDVPIITHHTRMFQIKSNQNQIKSVYCHVNTQLGEKHT